MTESPDQANPGPHGESMWSPSKRVAVGSFISMAGSADSGLRCTLKYLIGRNCDVILQVFPVHILQCEMTMHLTHACIYS